MTQGAKLKELVKRSELKQMEIADKLGYTSTHLTRLYKAEILPTKAMMKAIEVFELPNDYFLSSVELTDGEKAGKTELEIRMEILEREIAQMKEENEQERNRLLKIIENLSSK